MFEYDEQKAMRTEGPARITEPGAYIGTILQCERTKARNTAAEFVRIWFRTDDKVDAWLDLCVKKSDGSEAFGVGYVMALMGLTNVKRMEAKPHKCRSMKGDIVDGERYFEIENQRIGFVLGMDARQYTDSQGFERIAYNPRIARIFDPETGKTITEKKKNLEANAVAREIEKVKVDFEKLKAKIEAERANAFESQPRTDATTSDTLPYDDAPF